HAGVGGDVKGDAGEEAAAAGVHRRGRVAARVVGVQGPRATEDRVAVGVLGGRGHGLGVVELLPERRQLVAPVAAVVEGPGDRALVEADPAVVGAGQQVGRLGRVVDDVVLGVAPEGAVLVDPDVAVGVAVAAAEGAGADADVALAGLGGDGARGGEQPGAGPPPPPPACLLPR